ncbi:unnamed protein product [Parascedosporium putredinis]|uniref:Protein YOP1 n=1 Tax=Parascedosporium putredinis TaxID=1442378 RepID=A0A9P1H111_9PEZI|nr:unnamed protein product [Parascedosporium putredinis]CAI7992291.1 unnamed protein product [Parascedosporium putredinis]
MPWSAAPTPQFDDSFVFADFFTLLFARHRVPFYAYIRLVFLLYLVLPQTQGARILYQTYVHPYLEQNETKIEDFIASTHERLKAAGLSYLKQAIALLKTKVLGMPPEEPAPAAASQTGNAQSYTQNLLSRFSVPAARWAGAGISRPGVAGAAASTSADFYGFLASAVSTAMTAGTGSSATSSADRGLSASGSLIPANLQGADKINFIAAQRDRLTAVLNALDREARTIEREDTIRATGDAPRSPTDISPPDERPPSGLSSWSGLSKSRSEVDFEKIDVDSAAEEDPNLRHRTSATTPGGGGSWMPWGWGSGTTPVEESTGHSSSVNKSPQ